MDYDISEGVYMQLLTKAGTPTGYAFQQFHQSQVRTYKGIDFIFAAFEYSGASIDLGFPNAEAVLVFNVNTLSLNIWKQAADEFWIARVRTVWLDPSTLIETGIEMVDNYAITGFDHDLQQVSLRLGSPLDAIGSDWPRRVLTQAIVGALPPNGEVTF
jgi:hypothetical protein